MSDLINDDIKTLLLIGSDISVDDILLKNYKLGEIFNEDFGLTRYNWLCSLAIVDKDDVIDYGGNKELKEEIKDLDLYDLLPTLPNIQQWYTEFLNTFTCNKWVYNSRFNTFMDIENKLILDKEKTSNIVEVFKKMYWVERGSKNNNNDFIDPSKAVNDEVRALAEEFAEMEKESKSKKSKITLNGIIAGVCSTSNRYDFFNIKDLTMYQLMTIYFVNENRDHYQYVMQSAYVGMYDLKKTKIEDIHYCREIDT